VAGDSFKEFVPDPLKALQEPRARAIFGAHGLYSGEKFFGTPDEGRLFFKMDAQSSFLFYFSSAGSRSIIASL
jgi:TfoX/Sxy family transcriptional regulator of competence genes